MRRIVGHVLLTVEHRDKHMQTCIPNLETKIRLYIVPYPSTCGGGCSFHLKCDHTVKEGAGRREGGEG